MTLRDLANKYAYAILTCDGSTDDSDSVLESWSEGKQRDDVIVWSRFSELDPDDLLDEHTALADAFRRFYAEATNSKKEGTNDQPQATHAPQHEISSDPAAGADLR